MLSKGTPRGAELEEKERGKINIFEEDSAMLKQESLLKIGFDDDEKSLVKADSESSTIVAGRGQGLPPKPALAYIKRTNE